MKKKYLMFFIICSFLLLFLSQILRKNTDIINYKVDGYNVIEKIVDKKIYITIEKNDTKYYYIYDINDNKQSVEKILSYSDDNYTCIFINFIDGSNSNDFICNNDGVNYNYSLLSSHSSILDSKYNKLVQSNEIIEKIDDVYNFKEVDLFKFYTNNLDDNLIFSLTNYKGLYIVSNQEINRIVLFDKDVYEQKIKAFVQDKYLVADYNAQYDFNSFYIVDLKTRKVKEINSKYSFSFDSTIIDVLGDSVYLYDNDKIYKIDTKKNKVTLSNDNINKDTYYLDDYEIIYESKNNYYLKKDYIIYRSNLKSSSSIIYLFDNINKDKIKFNDDYVYFLEDNTIKYYDNSGFKSLAFSNEFSFNKNLDFIIIKK